MDVFFFLNSSKAPVKLSLSQNGTNSMAILCRLANGNSIARNTISSNIDNFIADDTVKIGPRPVRRGVSKGVKDGCGSPPCHRAILGVAHLQGIEGLGTAGETLGSPWIPLVIQASTGTFRVRH
jgi:hypothetical protein